VLAEYLKKMN